MPGGEDVRKVSRQDIQLVSTLIMIPLPFSSFILLPSFFFSFGLCCGTRVTCRAPIMQRQP